MLPRVLGRCSYVLAGSVVTVEAMSLPCELCGAEAGEPCRVDCYSITSRQNEAQDKLPNCSCNTIREGSGGITYSYAIIGVLCPPCEAAVSEDYS